MKLAFKNASAADSRWSEIIAKLTRGPYSHVEMWLSGPQDKADCFSSREGSGCGYAVPDLTDEKLWKILDVQAPVGIWIAGFCDGSNGKPYDYLDLLDALTGRGRENFSIGRFCSGVTTEALQKGYGLLSAEHFWQVSPVKLYNLLTK